MLPHAELLGAIGTSSLGLVWGWLLVLVTKSHSFSLTAFWKLILATALVGAEVFIFSDIGGLTAFICATGMALLLHWIWIRELRGASAVH